MKTAENKRYATLKSHPGIRKDLIHGGYFVTKSIRGKRYFASFETLSQAIDWKNTFFPGLPTNKTESKSYLNLEGTNGINKQITLGEVWEKYKSLHLPSLERASVETIVVRSEFYRPLFDVPLCLITPELIDEHIDKQKKLVILKNGKCKSFKRALVEFKSLLNWYRENYDFRFLNPVLKRHMASSVIVKTEPKDKKMSAEEALKFFSALDPYYRDFALVQFYIAGRVQEVAGIQIKNIDLNDRSLLIKEVVVWDKAKRFLELKSKPKNGHARYCFINDVMFEIFERHLHVQYSNCTYLFHENGAPLSYRKIQHAYNKALTKCGLYGRYSSTHIMRHSMATITRRVTGSLDATQAVTGHRDQRMVQHYATLPTVAQAEAVKSVEVFMTALSKSVRAAACEEKR